MHKFTVLILILFSALTFGQAIKYQSGDFVLGTKSKDASALLQMNSTAQGFLPPRMTEAQRDAIASPATGLIIYNTTANQLEVFGGSTFVAAGGGGISAWTTGFGYVIGNVVHESNKIYLALTNHTSGTFATDLGNNEWVELSAIDFTSNPVTGVLTIANGGTNSSTALNNNYVMISSGGSIVESSTIDTTELGYLNGVSANLQTQLDAKLDDYTSTTDNALIRSNGITGEAVQDSGVIIDDSDNITGVGNLTTTGTTQVNGTLDLNGIQTIDDSGASDALLITKSGAGDGVDIDYSGSGNALDVAGDTELDNVNAVGTFDITGDLDVDNINLNGNTIITTDVNGDLNLTPNGTGAVVVDALELPNENGTSVLFMASSGGTVDSDSELLWDNTGKRFKIGSGLYTAQALTVDGGMSVQTGTTYLQSTEVDGSLLVSSTTVASKPCPNMTTAQRTATTPAEGQCVYDTDLNSWFTYDGSGWSAVGAGGISEWATSSSYAINDVVWYDGLIYQSQTAHTSGTFATDLANGDWIEMTNTIPLMAKGSILTSNGTDNGEFTACPDGEVLIADSSQTSGFICKPHATEALTNWTTFTPTFVGFTVSSSDLQWRRVGENMEIRGIFTLSSAVTTTMEMLIPDGRATSAPSTDYFGSVIGYPAASGFFDGSIAPSTASGGTTYGTSGIIFNTASGEGAAAWGATTPATWASGNTVVFKSVSIPISGWTSNNSVTAFDCDGLECENEFSAYIDASGNVSQENVDWINGNCSFSTDTHTCTFNSGIFSLEPNCTATASNAAGNINTANNGVNTTTMVFKSANSSGTGVATPINVHCQRQGSDYNQYNHRFARLSQNAPKEMKLEGNDGRAITVNTESIPFSGTSDYWTSGADGSTTSNGNYYTVQNDNSTIHISVGVAFTAQNTGSITIHKNGSVYRVLSAYPPNDYYKNGAYIAGPGEFAAGDKIAFAKASATGTLTNDTTRHYLSIIEQPEIQSFITGNISESTFTETVKTEGATNPVMYSFEFGGASANTNCTASPCTIRKNFGSAASSVTRASAGVYNFTLTSGKFGQEGNCTCGGANHGASQYTQCQAFMSSATTGSVYFAKDDATWVAADGEVQVICHGVK